jgi:hypothetical protein
MGLDLKLHSELGIQHITPDIAVITLGNRLVGVVEVKKSGAKTAGSILKQPTVLGELLDQMVLVERIYACGPVIGILTTLKEWRFVWFPEDNEHFCEDHSDFRASSTTHFTPQKESASMQDEAKRCPPGTTPSHANPQCHRITEEKETEDSPSIALRDYETRRLCTSAVLDSERDKGRLLQFIYTSLGRMNQVKFNYRQGPGICVFQLHRGNSGISWHSLPVSFDMNAVISSSKYPRNNIQNLLAVEDLGRGSSGKVWLTMANSNNSAICVLKFHNYRRYEKQLETEKNWWDILYPEFASLVHVGLAPWHYACHTSVRSQLSEETNSTIRFRHFCGRNSLLGDMYLRT